MKIITNTRVYRSQVTPSGVATVTREMDFDMGPRMAIELLAAIGTYKILTDASPPTAPTAINHARQSLHAETGTLEAIAAGTVDEDVKDSEILFHQNLNFVHFNDTTNGTGGAAHVLSPNGIVHFPEGIIVPTNITHAGETIDADVGVAFQILLYYRYVEIEDAELAMLLAYRGR